MWPIWNQIIVMQVESDIMDYVYVYINICIEFDTDSLDPKSFQILINFYILKPLFSELVWGFYKSIHLN